MKTKAKRRLLPIERYQLQLGLFRKEAGSIQPDFALAMAFELPESNPLRLAAVSLARAAFQIKIEWDAVQRDLRGGGLQNSIVPLPTMSVREIEIECRCEEAGMIPPSKRWQLKECPS